jgi:hypothetical protein
VVPNFGNVLWVAIAVIEVFLVTVRLLLPPGPARLSLSLSIPALLILGAVANAIYNRVTQGHALDDLPTAKRR